MTIQVIDNRVKLKEPTGWFAAGATFRRALLTLSDGAFKLFAYLCVETDRQTGRFETTQRELARALGKSRRSVGSYSTELETNGICRIHTGANQCQFSRVFPHPFSCSFLHPLDGSMWFYLFLSLMAILLTQDQRLSETSLRN